MDRWFNPGCSFETHKNEEILERDKSRVTRDLVSREQLGFSPVVALFPLCFCLRSVLYCAVRRVLHFPDVG